MPRTLFAAAVCLAAVLALPGRADEKDEGEPFAFKSVLRALQGGPEAACEKVLTSSKDWDAFVESCTGADVRETLAKTEVDFEKEVLVAVALGRKLDDLTDFEAKDEKISRVTMKDDVWTIHYGTASTDVLCEPGYCAVFVIRLPKLGQTFKFDREEFCYGG